MSIPFFDQDAQINFFSEGIQFELKDESKITTWIKSVIAENHKELTTLNFILTSDEELYRINKQYLQHDTYTDIITFPMSEENVIEGDIFVSIDRIKDNAKNLKVTFENELHRVLIHGVLHLIGYDDKTPELKKEMRKAEDEALEKLKSPERTT